MDVAQTSVIAALFALIMALVEVIKHLVRRHQNSNSTPPDLSALTTAMAKQLSVLTDISQSLSAIRQDLRMADREHAHIQRAIDKIHERMDKVKAG